MINYFKKSVFGLFLILFIFGCSNNSIINNVRYKEIKKEIISCNQQNFLNNSNYVNISLKKRSIPSLKITELEIIFSDSKAVLLDIEIMIIDAKEKIKSSKTLFPTIGVVSNRLTIIPSTEQIKEENQYKGLTIYFDITKIPDITKILIYFAFNILAERTIEFIEIAI